MESQLGTQGWGGGTLKAKVSQASWLQAAAAFPLGIVPGVGTQDGPVTCLEFSPQYKPACLLWLTWRYINIFLPHKSVFCLDLVVLRQVSLCSPHWPPTHDLLPQ
jgi:hypothetical protein